MNFFQQLTALGQGLDVTLRVKGKNGLITVSVETQYGQQSKLIPLVLTGTPEEMDEGFFGQFDGGMTAAKGLISNLADVKKDAEEIKKAAGSKKRDNVPPSQRGKAIATAKTNKEDNADGAEKAKGKISKSKEPPRPVPVDMFGPASTHNKDESGQDAAEGSEESADDHNGVE